MYIYVCVYVYMYVYLQCLLIKSFGNCGKLDKQKLVQSTSDPSTLEPLELTGHTMIHDDLIKALLVAGFKHFLFSIIYGNVIIPTDYYFSEGFKPPTSYILELYSPLY